MHQESKSKGCFACLQVKLSHVPLNPPLCFQCNVEYRIARIATWPLRLPELITKCKTCGNPCKVLYPDAPSVRICLTCDPYVGKDQACFNCERCRAERKYLNDTDAAFPLRYFANAAEFRECLQCHQAIATEERRPSSERTVLQVMARRNHLKFLCESFKSGHMSFG